MLLVLKNSLCSTMLLVLAMLTLLSRMPLFGDFCAYLRLLLRANFFVQSVLLGSRQYGSLCQRRDVQCAVSNGTWWAVS
jgi:hypothetical protein